AVPRLLRGGALGKDLVEGGERCLERLALLRPLDEGGHLDQLEVARHRLVDVEGGVEAHLAQAAAHASHRVEQLVAHDAEGRMESLRGPEELLLEELLLDTGGGQRLLVERGRPRNGSLLSGLM